jgi:hypothetical protein
VGGRLAVPLAVVTLVCVTSRRAAADPQISAGVTAGGVIEDAAGPAPPSGAFHLGARGDALLLRSSPRDPGLGPYLDVATASFHNLDLGGGLEGLLPLTGDFAAALSGGAFARDAAGGWAPGVEGTLFVGGRSYNYDSVYGLALGLFAQTRWLPAAPSRLDVVIGAQVDAEVLVLPFLLAWGALTHGS